MALVKGAPEVLASHFANAPPNYGELHRHHARQGSRVLALGYKVRSREGGCNGDLKCRSESP